MSSRACIMRSKNGNENAQNMPKTQTRWSSPDLKNHSCIGEFSGWRGSWNAKRPSNGAITASKMPGTSYSSKAMPQVRAILMKSTVNESLYELRMKSGMKTPHVKKVCIGQM